jgi:hypothetical protein
MFALKFSIDAKIGTFQTKSSRQKTLKMSGSLRFVTKAFKTNKKNGMHGVLSMFFMVRRRDKIVKRYRNTSIPLCQKGVSHPLYLRSLCGMTEQIILFNPV